MTNFNNSFEKFGGTWLLHNPNITVWLWFRVSFEKIITIIDLAQFHRTRIDFSFSFIVFIHLAYWWRLINKNNGKRKIMEWWRHKFSISSLILKYVLTVFWQFHQNLCSRIDFVNFLEMTSFSEVYYLTFIWLSYDKDYGARNINGQDERNELTIFESNLIIVLLCHTR